MKKGVRGEVRSEKRGGGGLGMLGGRGGIGALGLTMVLGPG